MSDKTNNGGIAQQSVAVKAVPKEALHELDSEIAKAGGELAEPAEYVGSIGRTLFDTPTSADGTITVLLPADRVKEVTHQ